MPRRRQSLEARSGKGNPTNRPMPKAPPQRILGVPSEPSSLSPGARGAWHYYCEVLRRRGQLGVDSGPALELLSETAAEVDALRRAVRERGRFQSVGGREFKRPAYAALRGAGARLLRLLGEFGLTPRTELERS